MRTLTAGLLALATLLLISAALPKTGPVPEENPIREAAEPKSNEKDDATEKNAEAQKSDSDDAEKTSDETKPDEQATPKSPPPPPVEKEDPAAYAACISDLKAIGAAFTEKERIDDGNGCGIDKPIEVTAILPGVKIEPAATLRCEAALALAHWTRDTVIPMSEKAFPKAGRLTSLSQASSYICRNRNSAATGKLSEHARGNAIDIATFKFEGGKTLSVEPRGKDSTFDGAFQRSVREAACLDFTTVLGPPSDDAHRTHLHLDVIKRRGGFRYCW
ncbi:extensin family protein [Rhizobium sp. NRK18]|uniref:extensin-like domain-containing protein n=1 Tax=Rhizobium sp. NRK18 TaxID=2964667 RepID=UPI0021C28BF1|nr:extensin family protein [Rhizobium sp. NRK18]MCQ2003562.1 extensin family protein [Rhizobium sp. NRK18]